jgi:hypothetical protein
MTGDEKIHRENKSKATKKETQAAVGNFLYQN